MARPAWQDAQRVSRAGCALCGEVACGTERLEGLGLAGSWRRFGCEGQTWRGTVPSGLWPHAAVPDSISDDRPASVPLGTVS